MIKVDITPEMVAEAIREEAERVTSQGKKTHPVKDRYGHVVRRDIHGSLAHQAVEIWLNSKNISYDTTRTVNYVTHGDLQDIVMQGCKIDVKGTGAENSNWFFENGFLVFQHQLNDSKIQNITHFLFVRHLMELVDDKEKLTKRELGLVAGDFMYKEAWIFGIITRERFMEESKEKQLTELNREIPADRLCPFEEWVWK